MDSIAIIGLAGQFPGAVDVGQFWRNLCAGEEGITFFNEAELIEAGLPSELIRRPEYVPAKGYLSGAELFDAEFFGYHPREAEVLDPQQRLLLECAWTALEDAGYATERFRGAIGVFAGVSMNTYVPNNLLANRHVMSAVGGYQVMISNDKDYAPTRISYLLNLTGPSIAIQTACSTSLVAVERACRSLIGGECDMALAGGASVSFPRRAGYLYQEGMILSPDGHCRPFDARARGTVGGEGVGLVVLKRLSDALRDGDNIRALIRGWAANNDGAAKVGYTAPGVEGQAAVIAMAQAMAGVEPRSITYVEAHGTGTELGDPVEISALSQVFPATDQDSGYCRIGSVKSNIGHLDAAAGIAGLIKTVLALQHGRIPPTLHFEQPNPRIDFVTGPFRVCDSLSDWTTDRLPRRAGISSFGIGGTNAHLVLEEPPPVVAAETSRAVQLLLLSAKTSEALTAAAANLCRHLQDEASQSLADVAYTLHVGRQRFPHRLAIVCRNRDEAVQSLGPAEASGRKLTSFERAASMPVTFMLPGQGAQHRDMGKGLYESEPRFREAFDVCAELLDARHGIDLHQVVDAADPRTNGPLSLRDTALAQPALFAVEYALACLWAEWGVRPAAIIGHSLGEYVAACLAGVFSLPDALWLVARRGALMQSAEPGAMLAVPLSETEVQELLTDGVALAACNAPGNSVVAGPHSAIESLEGFLHQQGFATRRLITSHAFHSPLMEPIRGQFRACAAQVERRPPQIPFISNVTGTWIEDRQATDPDYWAKHLLSTVRFADGLSTLLRRGGQIFLEVGPGQSLAALIRQLPVSGPRPAVVSSMRHPTDQRSDDAALAEAVGRLWLAGADLDWSGFHRHERRRRAPLPTYPFERKRYCVEPSREPAPAATNGRPARRALADWFHVPSWRRSTPVAESPANQQRPHTRDRWLLFLDEAGVGRALLERLSAGGQPHAAVCVGEEFSASEAGRFTLNPRRFGDYVALFDELGRRGEVPDRIVHLWNVNGHERRTFDAWQTLGFYSLLYLTQVLGRLPTAQAVRIDVISNGIQEVTGSEELVAGKATLLGPVLVVPQEYPHLVVRSIDLDLPRRGPRPSPTLVERLEQQLQREVTDVELALRGRYCWVRSYDPLPLPAAPERIARLRDRGAYWILGGLGQIGLHLATVLARSARARLVLTGRKPLPPRDQWDAYCEERDADEPDVRRIRHIRQLESFGAEVMVLPADLADRNQVREALEAIHARFGNLHGVIHAAGLVRGTIIHHLTPNECENQFRAKVRGLEVLEELLAGQPLDFWLLTSSLSTVLGGMGFCAYAAANAYLDAVVARKNRAGGATWLSIDWDGWRNEWVNEPRVASPAVEWLLSGVEGEEAFQRILGGHWPDRIVISTSDLQPRLDQWVRRNAFVAHSAPEASQPLTRHPRPANIMTPYVAPRSDLERAIVEVWQHLLGIDPIGVHDNYIELGGHSLLAGQLTVRLRALLKVPLSIRSLFESPTVARLAEHIEAQRWAMQNSGPLISTTFAAEREELEL